MKTPNPRGLALAILNDILQDKFISGVRERQEEWQECWIGLDDPENESEWQDQVKRTTLLIQRYTHELLNG